MYLFIPNRTPRDQPIYKNTRAEWYSLQTRQINNYVLWNYVAAKFIATRYIKPQNRGYAKRAKIHKNPNRENCKN